MLDHFDHRGGIEASQKLWKLHDDMLYPILLEAGLVKARKK